MKKTTYTTLAFIVVSCLLLFVQGCGRGDAPISTSGTQNVGGHGHDCPLPKYNEVLVRFPGHSYALEIIDEKETTGLVTAFLTCAHFEPVEVDTQEVRLNFMIDGNPKAFTLTRIEQEPDKPATFTLTDMELATLLCEGWQGEARAMVEINGVPYRERLVKLEGHVHGPDCDH